MQDILETIKSFLKALIDFFKIQLPENAPPEEAPEPEKPALFVSGTVRRNMEGQDVLTIQTYLHSLGYDVGPLDGIFQGRTETAVINYQKDHNLKPDGIVGSKTLGSMGIMILASTEPLPVDLDRWKTLPEGTIEFYTEILRPGVLRYDPGFETAINNVAKRIMNEQQYKDGMKALGFPDFASDGTPSYAFAGLIHNLEASGNFSRNFVNGEPINVKTTKVPAGLGPWANWRAAFIDGMKYKNITPQKYPDLTGPLMCYIAERYNGLGYVTGAGKAQWSPYIGAQSNISLDKGKYTSDGKYDPNANANGQTGFATGLVEIYRLLKIHNTPAVGDSDLFNKIMRKNPNIDPQMVKQALPWLNSPLVKNKDRMMLVNYNINEKYSRSYLIELSPAIVGDCDLSKMAHGTKSDTDKDGLPTHFGNVPGSNKSSLGAKVMGSTYKSSKGFKYSRHVYGLEKGLNDNDFIRAVKWHSSTYVNDSEGVLIGDSLACLTQSEATCKRIVNKLQDILIYVYANEIQGRSTSMETIING